jgi:hypothetical protein
MSNDGMLTPVEQRVAGVTLGYLARCTTVGSAVFAEILSRPRAGSMAESALKDKDLLASLGLSRAPI